MVCLSPATHIHSPPVSVDRSREIKDKKKGEGERVVLAERWRRKENRRSSLAGGIRARLRPPGPPASHPAPVLSLWLEVRCSLSGSLVLM
ncbi:hypothetical protein EYF80_060155 [Liparis tanakae]|uniref:Uncharacterized protein n=1 Tax=Liparis tanakae TaxID=230148 RepID=A0A4Z2ELC3_9TELE|nr:hypothetical protein EYF80_060155 [Liparis tanakae]